jgi:hypothetical protein
VQKHENKKAFREAYIYDSKRRFGRVWMIGNKEKIRG